MKRRKTRGAALIVPYIAPLGTLSVHQIGHCMCHNDVEIATLYHGGCAAVLRVTRRFGFLQQN